MNRKTYPIDGWLILDKPLGLTSAQAVGKARRITGCKKIGHAGTLDPLATGVLPLALGEGTKTIPFIMDAEKAYRFEVTWGEARSTDDAEGEVTATHHHRPSRKAIEAILERFTGQVRQLPPIYSALKVAGQRAYALARKGETPELAPRDVIIYSLVLEELPDQDRAVFTVCCGKGTYVRALARDLAVALGTVGYVSALRRLKVGKFSVELAISLENLEKLVHNPTPDGRDGPGLGYLWPVESALDDIPAFEADSGLATRLRSGQPLPGGTYPVKEGSLVLVKTDGRAVALCRMGEGLIKPVRVFNL